MNRLNRATILEAKSILSVQELLLLIALMLLGSMVLWTIVSTFLTTHILTPLILQMIGPIGGLYSSLNKYS